MKQVRAKADRLGFAVQRLPIGWVTRWFCDQGRNSAFAARNACDPVFELTRVLAALRRGRRGPAALIRADLLIRSRAVFA